MSTIENINNNNLRMIVPHLNTQNVQDINTKITKIDKKIEFNDKLIEVYKEKKDNLKNLINSNKEYILLLQESKDLDGKRIGLMEKQISLLQDTNDKLQALLDRNSGKIEGSDIKSLEKQLDTFAKKENILKTQANMVDKKIEKLAVKVNFVEKQITKLETKGNNVDDSNVQVKLDKNSFVTSYRPTDNQIAKLELSKIKQDIQDIKDMDAVFQQKTVNSQKNIYESIMSKVIADKITKLL